MSLGQNLNVADSSSLQIKPLKNELEKSTS
jgi:hypothetical protein